MGAALSCVALPALGSLGTWIASCFSAAACSLACKRYIYAQLALKPYETNRKAIP
jgi:hypothetical protein